MFGSGGVDGEENDGFIRVNSPVYKKAKTRMLCQE